MNEQQINELVNNILKGVNVIENNNKRNIKNQSDIDDLFKIAFANFGSHFTNSSKNPNVTVNTFVNDKKIETDNESNVNKTNKKHKINNESKTIKKTKELINMEDIKEDEFDIKVRQSLTANTNPQLRFIASQLGMSKTVFKNKSEYINSILEFLLSRTQEQLDRISKSNKIAIEYPKYKQIIHVLSKL